MAGIAFVPLLIGLYALAQCFTTSEGNLEEMTRSRKVKLKQILPSLHDIKRCTPVVVGCSILGTIIGAIPGTGGDIASWVGYNEAKRWVKKNEVPFGEGTPEGIAAPESANNAIVGGAVPKEYIPAVDAGIQGAMNAGVVAGFPVVDVKVTLYDGSYHEVDSSEMAFKIAGSMAFKEACRKADPTLLEPIMKVSVIVPDEYMGDVIGDLNSRRGQILGMEARPGAQQIDALVPLANMFGYATDLRSSTQGRGQYSMEPHSYVEIPKSIAEKIIAERGRKDD